MSTQVDLLLTFLLAFCVTKDERNVIRKHVGTHWIASSKYAGDKLLPLMAFKTYEPVPEPCIEV